MISSFLFFLLFVILNNLNPQPVFAQTCDSWRETASSLPSCSNPLFQSNCTGTGGSTGTQCCQGSTVPGGPWGYCENKTINPLPQYWFRCCTDVPTPTPCPGLSACFITGCTFFPGACGVSTCSGNPDCAAAATPTPIPPTPTSAPSCPDGYTLCSGNACYSCPADYTVNCSTNPVSCTFTGTAPTPTPTIASGGNCGAYGCDGPNLRVSWTRNGIWPAYDLQLTKAGTLTNACSGITNPCRDSATVGDVTSYTFTGLGTNGYYDLYIWVLGNLWNSPKTNLGPTGACTGGFCTPATPTPTPTPVRLPTSTPVPTAVPTYSISGTVYIDNNGNGAPDAGEPAYNGAIVARTGSALSETTNISGFYSFSGLTAGGYTITLSPITGYVNTTANSVPTSVGPANATVNFGIAPARTISGNVFVDNGAGGGIANNGVKEIGEATYTAGITITSTISSLPIGIVSYPTPGQFIVSGVYTKLLPYSITLTVIPAGYVISNAGASPNTNPRSVTVTTADVPNINFGIVPTYTISGNVFIDDGVGTACPGPTCGAKDGIKNGTEGNYTLSASTVQVRSGSCAGTLIGSSSPGNGAFSISNIPAGTYAVCYTTLPSGYQIINPTTGPPPFFTKSVGPSVPNVDFAILLYGPWIQSTCTDIRFDSGFHDPVPSTATLACGGPNASIPGTTCTTPGIIFTGDSNPKYLGQPGYGSASSTNWVVGGGIYPELFIPSKGNVIRTSYNYMNAQIKQAGLTPVDIATYCTGGINSCNLSTSIPHGLYIANGNLNLTGLSYTFPANSNYVILVNGTLTISEQIHVPKTSTAAFIVSGDIIVAPTVGETLSTSVLPDIEGFYSTDGNFITGGGNLRLNIAGSVIVNAAKTSPAGTFQLQRDLGAGNANCPAFSIQERPDFILNAPDLIKYQNTIYREVAP